MKSDVEIAQGVELEEIEEIASKIGLKENQIETLGNHKAKLTLEAIKEYKGKENGNLILVTSMTPTQMGEGKTTTAIGLTQSLWKRGKKTMVGLREPSIGPTMGIKGGAAGGGYSQVLPMEDINLHFTGDIHAVGMAHNLISAMINNHIYRGNDLDIDPKRIVWPRVMDMNDRALRDIVVGLGSEVDGVQIESSFQITASSEVMAVLCLAGSIHELKERLSKIILGYTHDGDPVKISDLGGVGAMAAMLKHAIKPNLVQTLEGVPAFVHGGPFANIAHGTSSLISTEIGMSLSDYFVTEAGFGSELGAEKFFHIVCRENDLEPDAVVMVATVRALKRQGGASPEELNEEDLESIRKGFPNLLKHLENMEMFGIPAIVAINRFKSDTERELDLVEELCEEARIPHEVIEVHQNGGEGGLSLADEVISQCEGKESELSPVYSLSESPKEKIHKIVTRVYGGERAVYTQEAEKDLKMIDDNGLDHLPICMSKTHYSLSDDKELIGKPEGFEVKIRRVKVNSGAGFLVPMAGKIRTMPGLPERPAALDIEIDENGKITGLF